MLSGKQWRLEQFSALLRKTCPDFVSLWSCSIFLTCWFTLSMLVLLIDCQNECILKLWWWAIISWARATAAFSFYVKTLFGHIPQFKSPWNRAMCYAGMRKTVDVYLALLVHQALNNNSIHCLKQQKLSVWFDVVPVGGILTGWIIGHFCRHFFF